MENANTCKIRRVQLTNFLGSINYDMGLNDDVSIITARNGCGKATIMKMIEFMLWNPRKETFEWFKDMPFDSFRCTLSNGRTVELRQIRSASSSSGSDDIAKVDFVYTVYDGDTVLHQLNYSEEYGPCLERRGHMGFWESRFLRESVCELPVMFLDPQYCFIGNYIKDDGTRYIWENKEMALDTPGNTERFSLFEQIFNERNMPTRKTISVDNEGVVLHSPFGKATFSDMSGGEAHDFGMFYNMLFNIRDGVVLIDEPERSIHIALQETFIDNVLPICKMNNLQVIMATHSPSIVNGYYDFVYGPGFIDMMKGGA